MCAIYGVEEHMVRTEVEGKMLSRKRELSYNSYMEELTRPKEDILGDTSARPLDYHRRTEMMLTPPDRIYRLIYGLVRYSEV